MQPAVVAMRRHRVRALERVTGGFQPVWSVMEEMHIVEVERLVSKHGV
jgi:hypothetical protein